MYVDKPMRGHGLMQSIARVNRVFKDKPGGLVVDYLGLAEELRRALATYTESGGTGQTALDQNEAVAVMLEKYESYPPDKQENATQTVLAQAEVLSEGWAA